MLFQIFFQLRASVFLDIFLKTCFDKSFFLQDFPPTLKCFFPQGFLPTLKASPYKRGWCSKGQTVQSDREDILVQKDILKLARKKVFIETNFIKIWWSWVLPSKVSAPPQKIEHKVQTDAERHFPYQFLPSDQHHKDLMIWTQALPSEGSAL